MPIPQNGQTHSKRFIGELPTNCLSVFDHFVKLALKGLGFYENNIEFLKGHPARKKKVDQHHMPFARKDLSKTIMKR